MFSQIYIPTAKPIKQRVYYWSPTKEKLLCFEIDSIPKMDVIEEAPSSPWSSPVKPSKVRFCVDARKLNAFNIPNRPLYQFKRMPFGLTNAPQTMCRLMDLAAEVACASLPWWSFGAVKQLCSHPTAKSRTDNKRPEVSVLSETSNLLGLSGRRRNTSSESKQNQRGQWIPGTQNSETA